MHFIEEPVFAAGEPGWTVASPCPGVTVLRPHTEVHDGGFADAQIAVLDGMVRDQLRGLGVAAAVAWFYTPMVSGGFRFRAITTARPRSRAAGRGGHRADRGPSMFQAKKSLHANVHCFPSAVDAAHFAPARSAEDTDGALEAQRLQRAISKPRLGFFGVIDERMGLALIDALAMAEPDWQLVMVGPVVKIGTDSLPRHPNVHWLGQQSYAALPGLVEGWDVCLLPFALNASTRFISPTKTLEYMAAEKPVVSTALRGVVGLYGEQVRIAHSPGEFIAPCRPALHEDTAERAMRIATMRAAVSTTSWDRTAEAIRHLIDAAAAARAGVTDKHWINYPEDTVFHRIFVQGNASPNNQPAGGFGLTCEITYSASKPLPAQGQALIDLCIADAKRVGLLRDDDQMITTNQVDMPCAYVVSDHARAAHVALIRDWLTTFDVILAGRYSEWHYYNSDHAFMAGRRAAQVWLAQDPVKLGGVAVSALG